MLATRIDLAGFPSGPQLVLAARSAFETAWTNAGPASYVTCFSLRGLPLVASDRSVRHVVDPDPQRFAHRRMTDGFHSFERELRARPPRDHQ
jgi:hypothetical protein